jgi:hypothetical protein
MKNTLIKSIYFTFVIILFSQKGAAQVEYSIQTGMNSSFFVHSKSQDLSLHTPYEEHSVDKPEGVEIRGVVSADAAFILHPRLSLGVNIGLNWRSSNSKFYDHYTFSVNPPVVEVKVHYPDQNESYSTRLGIGLNWFVIDQKLFLSLGISNDFVFLSNAWHTANESQLYEQEPYFDDHVLWDEQRVEYSPYLNLSGVFGVGFRVDRFDVMLNYYGGFTEVKRVYYEERKGLYQQTLELKVGYCFNRK